MSCKAIELKEAIGSSKFENRKAFNKYKKDIDRLKSLLTPVEVASDKPTPLYDSLPAPKEGVKTMTYAGVGSRETPIEIQQQMYLAAKELDRMGYTLRSGGALGADKAFEGAPQPWKKKDGTVAGTKEFTKSKAEVDEWSKYSNQYNSKTGRLKNKEIYTVKDANDTTREIAKEIHPASDRLSDYVLDLQARNTFQIFGKDLDTPVDFVLTWTPKGEFSGDTAQAMRLAIGKGIPVINMAKEGWQKELRDLVGPREVQYETTPTEDKFNKDYKDNIDKTIEKIQEESGNQEDLIFGSDIKFVADSEGKGGEEMVLDMMNNPQALHELASEIADLDKENGFVNKNEKLLLSLINNMTDTLAVVTPKIYASVNREAARNGGMIQKIGGITQLTMSFGPGHGNRTGLEVLTEELIHAVTLLGLDLSDPRMAKILREMEEIRETFFKEFSPAKLAKFMPDQTTAKEDAQELWNYLSGLDTKGNASDKINGLGEFMAKAVSNPYVMRALTQTKTSKAEFEGDTLAAKVVKALQKLFRTMMAKISKEPKTNDADRMVWFVDRLATINRHALDRKKDGVWTRIARKMNKANDSVAQKMDSIRSKLEEKDLPVLKKGDSKLASLFYFGKLIPMTFYSDKARNTFGSALTRMGVSASGTLRRLVKDIIDQDDFSNTVEALGMARQNVDREIMLHEKSHIADLQAAFGRDLTEQEKRIVVTMSRLDAPALMDLGLEDGNSIESLFNKDGAKLDKAIEELEAKIRKGKKETVSRYYSKMSEMLGRYLVTGQGNKAMVKNAYGIANMVQFTDPRSRKADKQLVKDIDALASLYAIKHLNVRQRQEIKKFVTSAENKDGVKVVGVLLASNKKFAEENLFTRDDMYLATKGHLAEVMPDGITQTVRPVSMQKELEKQGYKLEAKLPHRYTVLGKEEEMAVYTSKVDIQNRIHSSGFKYVNTMREGHTMGEQYRLQVVGDPSDVIREAVRKEREEVLRITNEIMNGTYVEKEEDTSMSPVLNEKGEIVDFTYTLTHEFKKEHLGAVEDPHRVLAKTIRNIVDTVEGKKHNTKLVRVLKEHMSQFVKDEDLIKAGGEHVTNKKTRKSYTLVSSKSTNKKIRELWFALDREVRKEFAEEVGPDGKVVKPEGIYVRDTEILDVLGDREMSLANNFLADKLSPQARYNIKLAEEIWKNVVALAKTAVIIKMPFVLIDTIISNTAIILMNWHNPKRVMELQMEGVSEINKYMRLHKELISLEAKQRAGVADQNEIAKINRIKERMNNSPMKPLVDAGFFTQILEETEIQEQQGKIVEDWLGDKMKNMPGFIKTGADWLFLTDRNIYHKFMYTFTQYSDLAARYASYHLMKEEGKSEKEIQKYLRNAFINYNKPDSALIEWANQMGLVMFTKYYIRIQRFLLTTARDNPLKLGVALGADEILNDYPDVTDSSIMNKGLDSVFYFPWQHAITAATPGALIFADNVTS